jgi:hypothetical protein
MKKQTVTSELRKIIGIGLGRKIKTVYSDERGDNSVGVKFVGLIFDESEKDFIIRAMKSEGFECRYIKISKYFGTCTRGTRLCFKNKSVVSQDSARILTYKETNKKQDMKKFKVANRLIHLNVEIPFQIGQVKGNAIVMVFFDNTRDPDIDYADVQDVTYMDMPVKGYDGWKKLITFHQELGIDLNKLVDDYAKSVLTESVVKQIMNENN